jgi:hypothetical protein
MKKGRRVMERRKKQKRTFRMSVNGGLVVASISLELNATSTMQSNKENNNKPFSRFNETNEFQRNHFNLSTVD